MHFRLRPSARAAMPGARPNRHHRYWPECCFATPAHAAAKWMPSATPAALWREPSSLSDNGHRHCRTSPLRTRRLRPGEAQPDRANAVLAVANPVVERWRRWHCRYCRPRHFRRTRDLRSRLMLSPERAGAASIQARHRYWPLAVRGDPRLASLQAWAQPTAWDRARQSPAAILIAASFAQVPGPAQPVRHLPQGQCRSA